MNKSPAAIYLFGLAPGSRAAMRSALNVVAEHLQPGAKADTFPWETVRFADLQQVRAWLIAQYAPRTVNRMLSAIRGVLKTCWSMELMATDAYQRTIGVKSTRLDSRRSGRVLREEEIKLLLPRANSAEKALIALLYAGGLRRAEACALNCEDYKRPSLKVLGKRNKFRHVSLHADWCELIEAAASTSGPLITVRGRRIRPNEVNAMFHRLRQRAGVDPFTPHDFRRSFATAMLSSGEDLLSLKELMGHEDLATTSMYDHRSDAHRQRAADRFGGVPK